MGLWGHAHREFWVLEKQFPSFSAGHFQQITTQENAVVSFLFYSSLAVFTEKKASDAIRIIEK